MGALHRLAQHVERARIRPEALTGRGRVAGPQRIDLADPHRIDPEGLGDAIHVRFGGKLRLRRAEAAKRAVWRRVRHGHASADPEVIAAIRSAGVEQPAREHDPAERGIGAAVQQHVDVHRQEPAVAGHPRAMADDARVPLRRGQHVLDAVVNQLYRPSRLPRQQRSVARDHRRVFFLAAESAAGLGLNDTDLLVRQPHHDLDRAVHVVGTLHRSVDRDAWIHAGGIGNGNDAVRLDVQLLLETDAVLAFDKKRRRRQRRGGIPLVDRDRFERDW